MEINKYNTCGKCNIQFEKWGGIPVFGSANYMLCDICILNYYSHRIEFEDLYIQPERSKRENPKTTIRREFECGCYDTDRWHKHPLCKDDQHIDLS